MSTQKPLEQLSPRVCDCDYCRRHPAALVSDPDMVIELEGAGPSVNKQGDQLANFYHCANCGDLLAVGCEVQGVFRGAINSNLLADCSGFAPHTPIQPRLLSAGEKLERWAGLWGELKGV